MTGAAVTTEASSTPTAHPGARLVLHSCTTGTPARDGEILEVRGPNGSPPYLVRWANDGHVSLVFPGPGATIGDSPG